MNLTSKQDVDAFRASHGLSVGVAMVDFRTAELNAKRRKASVSNHAARAQANRDMKAKRQGRSK